MSNLPAPGVYNIDPVHSTVSFIAAPPRRGQGPR